MRCFELRSVFELSSRRTRRRSGERTLVTGIETAPFASRSSPATFGVAFTLGAAPEPALASAVPPAGASAPSGVAAAAVVVAAVVVAAVVVVGTAVVVGATMVVGTTSGGVETVGRVSVPIGVVRVGNGMRSADA
jgi:hypothetical protein